MREICTCQGLDENCFRCYGKGYYDSKVLSPADASKKRATLQNYNLIKCTECSSYVRNDRLERHMRNTHNISSVIPKKFVEHQPSISKQKRHYRTVWPWMEIAPKTIVTPPIPHQQIKQTSNVSKIQAGLLAPVPESYLEKAIRDIYPLYDKVSFGSNMKKTEMLGIKQYVKHHRNVNVYLFYQSYTRYKAILTNEFLIYITPKPHPKRWGSWNLTFNNYYTVTDIKEFVVPITDFTYFNNNNKVEYPPQRPLWIIDVL